ncbi:MAG: prolyl oligopeptidase family serine peptidase [Ignavibacteria bacterium]|nr:prolyl oligopeptidase family serine peptidase [Ignavibacteria bacterium]
MKKLIFCIIFFISISVIQAQTVTEKKVLDHDVYNFWKRLENVKISQDGKFTSFEINPQKGDGKLFIENPENESFLMIPRGYDCSISPNGDFAAFKIKVPEDTTRKYKFEKKKKENFPKESIGYVLLNENISDKDSIIKTGNLKSYKINPNGLSRLAYLTEIDKKRKDTLSKSDIDVFDLTLVDPINKKSIKFENVVEYDFAKNGNTIGFMTLKKGKTDTTQVFILNLEKENPEMVFSKKGYGKNLEIDESGKNIAFIHSADTSKVKRYGLYLSGNAPAKLIADTTCTDIPQDWEISQYADINFSSDGKKLYFGTAPKIMPEPKDTLIDEEKAKIDVWNYQDPYLQTQQLHDLDKTKKRNFLAVYDSGLQKVFQLGNEEFENIRTADYGKSDFYLAINENPYKRSSSWIQPDQADIYSINYKTGKKELVAESVQYGYGISPTGRFIHWYENSDSSWYVYSNETGAKYSLTKNIPQKFGDELNDVPNIPQPYGMAVWTTNDNDVLIYDRFDLWKISPMNIYPPVRMTKGREENTVLRYQKLDNDSMNIGIDDKILLKAANESNWQEGFYETTANNTEPVKLIILDNKFVSIYKSKKNNKVLFQKCTYTEYPDLWSTDMTFGKLKRLSDANPQQKDYLWGTVEIVNWKGFDGEDMKGLLYKPENFDASKKYPMISYFYERSTDRFNQYYIPSPSRSTVNIPLYNSSGYIIFVPDIFYEIGHPGKSAYNTIVSGCRYLADNFSFIDRDNIGIQGQSWGGYQVAYLVTQTDFFKAAMSGAPVSNMTSAYGGIRWESGVNRIFQYEKEQSRIGGTLWDKFDLFVENSPLFKADKVTTPLLIMANDGDGAVPWQQGIEFFVSLRRLDKKVWLLNYNGDEHNLMKWPNRVDLSIRMKQFFDYYLKGAPIPEWMKDGIPATLKGTKSGYDLK